ncbi:MAG: hypothetical protein [aquatic viral metagenome]
MRGWGVLILNFLVPALAGELAVGVWMELSPHLGRLSLVALVGFVVVGNLLSVFILGLLNGSEASSIFREVFGGWIADLSDELRRLDEVRRGAITTLEELSRRLADPELILRRVEDSLDAYLVQFAVELDKILKKKVEMQINQMVEDFGEATRIWFHSLLFVEEIKALPKGERCKALELWFEGLDGEPERWRQLAGYFRDKSRK